MSDNPFVSAPQRRDDNPFVPQQHQQPPPVPVRTSGTSETSSLLSGTVTTSVPSAAPVAAPPQSYSSYGGAGATSDRERSLAERERALQERERALVARHGGRVPNWPPFLPKKFCRQDFVEDFQDPSVRTHVRFLYVHWLATFAALLYNLGCSIGAVTATSSAIADVILSLVWVVGVGAFDLLVYRVGYGAARTGKAVRHFLFFVFLAIEILIVAFAALGWVNSGWVGFLWMIKLFSNEMPILAIMALVNTVIWIGSAIFCIYMWIRFHALFKRAGGLAAAGAQAGAATADASIRFAKDHPDLAISAAKAGARAAADHPDLVLSAAKAAV